MNVPAPLTSFMGGTDIELAFVGLENSVAQRLRDLGLREGARIAVLQNSGNVILRVAESRIGLRRELAMHIFGIAA